jgi:hypothetical protein
MKKWFLSGILLLALTQCREALKREPQNAIGKAERGVVHNAESARDIAMEVQLTLGKTLIQHIQSEGVSGAISYCNVNALPITDSISKIKGVKIQRVTDRPRNPTNEASPKEVVLMNQIRNSKNREILPEDLRIVQGESVAYYLPIKTADLCLKCHGSPERDLNAEAAAKIAILYPDDQAVGYGANELRGLWKVTYTTTSNQ